MNEDQQICRQLSCHEKITGNEIYRSFAIVIFIKESPNIM